MSSIGLSETRVDVHDKVTGKAKYPGDINFPNQAYMKILFAKFPHAVVKKIETSKAEAVPGVLAVITAKDVPVNEYGLIVADQPVLCGPGSTNQFADRVRFIGDQIALVVAETELIAENACKLIDVDYEELPVITDPLEAIKDGSPLIHVEKGSNVFCTYNIRKGNIEQAFAAADVIIESEYRTPAQEHAFLQPEAGLSYIDDEGRVTVVVAGQWTHEDQEQIAHALSLPIEKVRVIYPSIGGAFGGREDMSVQIVLALAAWRLDQRGIHRPVKIIWSREESITGHHKRHPYIIRSRWGATRDGNVIAADVEIIEDGGAYAYTSTKVMGNATLMCTGAYEIENVKVDAHAVYTNNLPNGAFRGFGGPQAVFSAETQMNKLAEALGMDPVEIRSRNLLKEGSILSVQTPIPKGVSLTQVVESCAVASGWNKSLQGWYREPIKASTSEPKYLKTGWGFACSFKNVGFSFGAPEQCTATVELMGDKEIEKVILYHAGADVGQGAHTVFRQMAAHALDVSVDKVELVMSDTASTQNSGSASASRLTFMAGNSIKGAAENALEKWKNEERPALSTFKYIPPATTPYKTGTGESLPNFAYGYVAQAVEVEVDVETGIVRIVNVISSNDVGKALNPIEVESQIEGAVVQAAGYTLMENFIQKDGRVLTPTLSTYLIPTVLDIPDLVESHILEYPDPIGPWGARGMAEMPFIPIAAATIAAVHSATGVWFDEFPLIPDRVLAGICKRY